MAGILRSAFLSWMINGGDSKEFFRRQRVNRKTQDRLKKHWEAYKNEETQPQKTGESTGGKVHSAGQGDLGRKESSRGKENRPTIRAESFKVS